MPESFRQLANVMLFAWLGVPAAAQTFVKDTASIPGASNSTSSENVDFGDVDLDGDFDAVISKGGSCCNDRNRIWINQGGQQAGIVGSFVDETARRFPNVLGQDRDIEFADFDNDGDLEICNSNTSSTSNQSSRFWVNQGGLQGGSTGFYLDETLACWVALDSPGSSLSAGQLLGSGGFLDFCGDSDFADLDNDGDLDLVHSSYGNAFGGQIPTRILLNDGAGFFSGHNPSGFKLPGQNIAGGNPALWAEGTQQSNTTNSTGLNADVAASAMDFELGDIDGDWDFDLLLGAAHEPPRMFKNRLAESGVLIWRDVTSAVFTPGYSSGSGHYEQEFGDIDNDLDIFGLNWFDNFTDQTLLNNAGIFGSLASLAASQAADFEGDFGDFDNDGDLDLFVASIAGQDRLYRTS